MKYIVVIGDLINSRQISGRDMFQESLIKRLHLLNTSKILASKYAITLGDEFQAVFTSPEGIFEHFFSLMCGISPNKLRISIGIGEISTKINQENPLGMDGPAFHNARNGMNQIKESHSFFNIEGLSSENNNLVNSVLKYISYTINGWNENRLKIFYGKFSGNKVKDISKDLSISEQAVYKSIREGRLDDLVEIFRNIETSIKREII